MSNVNFSIGTKLAVSAGLSILLVLGMLANQRIGTNAITRQTSQVSDQQQTNEDTLAAGRAIGAMQTSARDIRLANTTEAVDNSIARLRSQAAEATRNLEAAARRVGGENRARFTAALALSRQYADLVSTMGDEQKTYLRTGPARTRIAVAWTKPYEDLRASASLASLPNRREVETALNDTHVTFFDVRVAAWRWAADNEPAMLDRISGSIKKTMAALARTRALTADPAVVAGIDQLAQVAGPFQGLVDEAAKALAGMNRQLQSATKVRTELDSLLEQAIANAVQKAQQSKAEAAATISSIDRVSLMVGLLVVVVLIGSAVFGRLAIAKPIRAVGHVLTELARGNKAVEIPYATRGDEVGDTARAAANFRDNLVRMERLEAEQRETEARMAADKRAAEERAAAERRTAEERAEAQRKADMHRLADAFQATVGGIIDTVSSASTELEAAAGTLTHTAETTQSLSATVASASEQASANVQSVATATEEMASSSDEIGRQVQESSRIALQAVKQAQATDARITALSQAAGRIGDVVKLITAVAEQTNLLALNATIEAARAGASGKGFAVVASEVKLLAAQTAKATDEIAGQIAGMQNETGAAVTAIKEIGGTIHQVSEIAAAIAAAVEEQGAATGEISRNIQQASRGTTLVASNIVQVNQGASETGSASAQVLSSAQQLSSESSRLKREVDKFLATIRAA